MSISVHSSPVAHQFDDLPQQRRANSLGMWTFLITEVMFFGGVFMGYAYYRYRYPDAFAEASGHLNIVLGTINTAVLIGSSLTMAMAVQSAGLGKPMRLIKFLLATIVLGSVFLGIKAYEWISGYREGHFPGLHYHYEGHYPEGAGLFFSFYYTMTGLHGLHMVIGIGIITVMIVLARRGRFTPESHDAIENTGLYWHYVDIVWIFLFPLLYLIGVHP